MTAGSAGSSGVSSIRVTPFCHATLPAKGWNLTPLDPATPQIPLMSRRLHSGRGGAILWRFETLDRSLLTACKSGI